MRKRVFAALLMLALQAQAETIVTKVSRCAGGDGPHPLSDISDAFTADTKVVPTKGGVKEFFFSEARNNLVYRNEANAILLHSLSEAETRPLTQSSLPLSRVLHSGGLYLLTEAAPWVFSLPRAKWNQFQISSKKNGASFLERLGSLHHEHGAKPGPEGNHHAGFSASSGKPFRGPFLHG